MKQYKGADVRWLYELCAFKTSPECAFFVECVTVVCSMESHKKKEDTAYATSSFFIDKLNLLNTDL